jgi:predicted O-methyltransferase YrrM
LRCADALAVLGEAGEFDLIFADAPGGKWEGLDRTIAALAPHGMLIVDDMTATPQWDAVHRARQQEVRQALRRCRGRLLARCYGRGDRLDLRRAP